MKQARHTRWVWMVIGLAMTTMMAISAINFLMDPWGLNYFLLSVANRKKVDSGTHENLHKAFAVRRICPKAIALGTSRVGQGIRSVHPAWGEGPVYNLAFNGAEVEEIALFLCGAVTGCKIRTVVIGLDSPYFNAYTGIRPTTREGASVFFSPLARARPYFTKEMFRDVIKMVWRLQKTGVENSILPGGEANPVALQQRVDSLGGHRKLFLRSEKEYFSNHYHNFSLADQKGSSLHHLREIVKIARKEKIALYLFISPSHARQWEALRIAGLWTQFEDWKRQLVTILDDDAKTSSDFEPIPLWDFSGYSEFTTETVPAAGDAASRMAWHWDPSHYKPALGDIVLDKVLRNGAAQSSRNGVNDFGIKITTNNIESHLAAIRVAQAKYHVEHAGDVRELELLYRETKGGAQ